MAVLPDYVTGTITLANGSVTVTGTGTMFATAAFRPGDTLQIQNLTAVIASVDSNTQLTLADPWTGTGLTDAPYRARYLPDGARVTAQTTLLIELLGNGVLSNIASIPVEEGNLLIGNVSGQYVPISKAGLGVQDPNGTLGEVSTVVLGANKLFRTDSSKAVVLADIGDLGGQIISRPDTTVGRAQVRADIRVATGELRNVLVNPLFTINQRAVSGTVTLSSGQFGHDRMKAGASGCTYTFSTNNGVTTLNITSGSIFQIIEASAFAGRAGSYVLSWAGTAQGRILSGPYGTSGNVSATCDGSGNVSVEFNVGTVSLVQFERDYVTDFCTRHIQQEIDFCQRYWQQVAVSFNGMVTNGATYNVRERLVPEMRSTPSLSATLGGGTSGFPIAAPSVLAGNPTTIVVGAVANATVSGGAFTYTVTCNAEI